MSGYNVILTSDFVLATSPPVSVPKGGDGGEVAPRGDPITEGVGKEGDPVLVVRQTASHEGVPFMEGEQVRRVHATR